MKHLRTVDSGSFALLEKVEKCEMVVTDVGKFRCFLLFGLEGKCCAKSIQVRTNKKKVCLIEESQLDAA